MSRPIARVFTGLASVTAGLLIMASCQEPIAPHRLDRTPSSNDISDGLHGDTGRLYFIAPLVRDPAARKAGLFDPTRAPVVTVCRWTADACEGSEMRFETDLTGSLARTAAVHVNVTRGWYSLIWKTPVATAPSARYRIRVSLDEIQLGYADVRVVDSLPVGTLLHDTLAVGEEAGDDVVIDTVGTISIQGERRLPIRFRLVQPAGRLLVAATDGVEGGPAVGDTLVPKGAAVPYRFVADVDHENLYVRIDGMLVPSEGVVVVDTTHVLIVTADRRAVVPDDAAHLYELARSVLTAADPAARYQEYLDAAGALVLRVGAESAGRTLAAIDFLAFQQIADIEAVDRVNAAVAGHVFTASGLLEPSDGDGDGGGGGEATLRTPSAASSKSLGKPTSLLLANSVAASHGEPTTFLYMNGVFTSIEKAQGTLLHLTPLVRAVSQFSDTTTFKVAYVVNHKQSEIDHTEEQRQVRCTELFGQAVTSGGNGFRAPNSFGPFMAECMKDVRYFRFSEMDLVESARQMYAIMTNSDALEPDAAALADTTQDYRNLGRHVIMVTHSQGSLMANQAIHNLRKTKRYQPSKDSMCIGAVTLASPTTLRWDLPPHYLKHVVVRGDPASLLPNTFKPMNTKLSKEIRKWYKPYDFSLHSVNESYLDDPVAGEKVQTHLRSIYSACAISRIVITAPTDSVLVGETIKLTAYALNAFDDRLAGRVLQWSSESPSVLSVNITGLATALTVGGSSVMADAGYIFADYQIRVIGTPPIIDSFVGSREETPHELLWYVVNHKATMVATAHATTPGATIVRYDYYAFDPANPNQGMPACCYGSTVGTYDWSLYIDATITPWSTPIPDGRMLVIVRDSNGMETRKWGSF